MLPRRVERTTVGLALLCALLVAPVGAALDASTASIRVTGPDSVATAHASLSGQGVAIAVLDTGVDDEHETLRGAFAAGVDVSSPTLLNGVADTPCSNPDDTDGHGTHVAAIALGRGATEASSNRGVAPGARLVDVKVAVSLTGMSLAGVERGFEWVLAYNEGRTRCRASDVERIRVVSVSFGTLAPGDPSDEAARLVNQLADSGVVVVAAAGNCGPDPSAGCAESGDNTIGSPGVARGAITVAAYADQGTADRGDDVLAAYSSRGPGGGERKPNVAAPGTAISSARHAAFGRADGWKEASGTSMATPHVAGIAALLLEAHPALTASEVKRVLQETAEDRGAKGWDPGWGWGAVDALRAVARVVGHRNLPPLAALDVSCRGLECTYVGDVSRDPDGRIVRWAWDFGDGHGGDGGPRSRHTYGTPGRFAVRLTITDDFGDKATASRTIHVSRPRAPEETRDDPPVARIAAEFEDAPLGATFRLHGFDSWDDEGVVRYEWDLGQDGYVDGDGPWFNWTPSVEGVYTVKLTVADVKNQTATAETAVVVRPREVARPTPPRDVAPPWVRILTPESGAKIAGGVRVWWEAGDNGSGLARTALFVDDGIANAGNATQLTLQLAAGRHVLEVHAYDRAGNAAVARVEVTVVEDEAISSASLPPAAAPEPSGVAGAVPKGSQIVHGAPLPGWLPLAGAGIAVALAARRPKRSGRGRW